MIRHSEMHDVDDASREVIEGLFERLQAIRELPENLSQVDAFEDLAADAESFGFPHIVGSCRWGQFWTYYGINDHKSAAQAYLVLMQHIHRYASYISDNIVDSSLREVYVAVEAMLDDAGFALDRIIRVIDLVEEHVVARGLSRANVFMARAQVASASGDTGGTIEWIDRVFAEGDEDWQPMSIGTIEIEVPIVGQVDPARAIATVESRLRAFGVDVRRLTATQTGPLSSAIHLTFLLRRLGHDDDARALADHLVDTFGMPTLEENTLDPADLVLMLTHRPQDALEYADRLLGSQRFDGTGFRQVAALARFRLAVDPEGEEGRLLRAYAEDLAALRDARGGTDLSRSELRDVWWKGLADVTRPAAADTAEWQDVEDRAELILGAGWLPRKGRVSFVDTPVALRDRFLQVMNESAELFGLESREESLALAQQLHARALRLRSATALYLIAVAHGFSAGSDGDVNALAHDYERAQQELLAAGGAIPEFFESAADTMFRVMMETGLSNASISWDQLQRIFATEVTLRKMSDRAVTPVVLAEAQVAYQSRNMERFGIAMDKVRQSMDRDGDRIDPFAITLSLVELAAFVGPDFAAANAQWLIDTAPAEYARGGQAWLSWLRTRSGDPEAPAALRRLVAELDDDLDAFHGVPEYVLLDSLARSGVDMLPFVDAALESISPITGGDLPTVASAASILLRVAPDDSRGPELREQALRLARALDERDQGTVTTTWVRSNWFPNDPAFGASA